MEYAIIILLAILILGVLGTGVVWARRRKHSVALVPAERVPNLAQVPGSSANAHRPAKPNALVVGDVQQPSILVQLYAPQADDRIEAINLHSGQLSGLEALVRHVPGLALAGASVASQTYVVRFAPEVAAQLASGSARMMRSLEGGVRAIAVGADGKIIGHGTLMAQTGLGVATAATAVWQVLAIVTAQYYLEGINRRLAVIEEKLDAVQARMDDQEAATLLNNFKRLRSIQAGLADGRLTDLDVQSFVGEVDTIDRECGRIMEACLMGMERDQQRLGTMNLRGTFDPADEVRAAKHRVKEYTHSAQVWAMAALARVAAAEVRGALPVDRGVVLRRLYEIEDELQRWEKARREFTELARKRARHVSTSIHLKWWEHDRNYQVRLLEAAKVTRVKLNESHTMVQRGLEDVEKFVTAQQALDSQPVNLLVDVNAAGNITGVRRLVANDMPISSVTSTSAAIPEPRERG